MTASLRSMPSESFLGDQLLPQIRGQEEMQHERSEWDRGHVAPHAPDILFSAVNCEKQVFQALDTNDASFAGKMTAEIHKNHVNLSFNTFWFSVSATQT